MNPSRYCPLGTELHARAVASSVMDCLFAAMKHPEQEEKWRARADFFESKFQTQYGKHFVHFIPGLGDDSATHMGGARALEVQQMITEGKQINHCTCKKALAAQPQT